MSVLSGNVATEFGAMELIDRLDKDLRSASRLLGRREARYLVDTYYEVQHFRTIAANQVRSKEEGGEPNAALQWVFESMRKLEDNIKRALGEYAAAYKVGQWLQSITGIGPVLSAGFLCHLDVRKAKTAGHFHSFAGLEPSVKWLGAKEAGTLVKSVMGEDRDVNHGHVVACAAAINRRPEYVFNTARFLSKCKPGDPDPTLTRDLLTRVMSVRPWNAKLKVLVYKAEDCFVKFQNHKNDHYGRLYAERRRYEQRKSDEGRLSGRAAEILESKAFTRDTNARRMYEQGKFPDGHLHAMAMRWTGKLFLYHLHDRMYRDYYEAEPPVPYAFAKLPADDHRHWIEIPNKDLTFAGKSLRDMGE